MYGMPSAARARIVGLMISSMMRACSAGVMTGAGEYAPMPPVFGPRSPSCRRLWSCEVASGSTCMPSAMTMKLASSPARNSSITSCSPAAPNCPANIASCWQRLLERSRDHHALAGREPARLHHQRQPLAAQPRSIEARAREGRRARARDAVAAEELLAEGLGALELRATAARARSTRARAPRRRRRCRRPAAPRARRW